jgi:hypothetical protein
MMTETDLWHMMLLAADNTFSGMAGIASITFAYLAAAYFVGAKLSRFQAALATVFYTISTGSWSFFTFVFYRRGIFFMRELEENYGIESFAPTDAFLPIIATALGLLIPACVFFMYQVRRNARPDAAAG